MKKIASLALLIATTVFFISSCKKEGTTVTKVINVEINANENYSYQVPKAGDDDDVMQITMQAEHFLFSSVNENSGNSGVLFKYTPALDYSGADEVQISNVEEHHNGHGSHGCSGHHKDITVYDFKINVKGNIK